jgi:transcriptional regulator with XRE-family HTH domain
MARPHVKRTKLHHLCDKANLTQRMFAELVGVDQSTASQWLSGKRLPVSTIIPKIAEVLGMEKDCIQALFLAMELRRSQTDSVCRWICTHIDQLAKEEELND